MAVTAKAWLRAQVVPGGAPCGCEDGEQYIEGLLAAARDPRTSDGFSPADLELATWHVQFHLEDELTNIAIGVTMRQAALEALSPLFEGFLPAFIDHSDAVVHFWSGLATLAAYPEIQFAYLDALGAFLSSDRPAFQASAIRGLGRCRLVAERTAMLDHYLTRTDISDELRARANSTRAT